MIAALARAPTARIFRTPRLWISAGAWSALAIASAIAMRAGRSPYGAFHTLVGIYAVVVLPLSVYALAGTVLGPRSLSSTTAQLACFGAPPARVAGVAIGITMLAAGVLSGALAALLACIAHGAADPPLAVDAVTSAYVGAVAGVAYAAWFGLGSTLGRRGGGRGLLLVLDWILGATNGVGAMMTPRGHLRNLLGGQAPLDISERASLAWIAVIAAACVFIVVVRARR